MCACVCARLAGWLAEAASRGLRLMPAAADQVQRVPAPAPSVAADPCGHRGTRRSPPPVASPGRRSGTLCWATSAALRMRCGSARATPRRSSARRRPSRRTKVQPGGRAVEPCAWCRPCGALAGLLRMTGIPPAPHLRCPPPSRAGAGRCRSCAEHAVPGRGSQPRRPAAPLHCRRAVWRARQRRCHGGLAGLSGGWR